MSGDEDRLYRKYEVRKLDDPEGKHTDCWVFVLDMDHDPHAKKALQAYVDSLTEEGGHPGLIADLQYWIDMRSVYRAGW